MWDVLEHWNNQHNLSHLLPHPEDWPTLQAVVRCFRRPFNVRSFVFQHIVAMLYLVLYPLVHFCGFVKLCISAAFLLIFKHNISMNYTDITNDLNWPRIQKFEFLVSPVAHYISAKWVPTSHNWCRMQGSQLSWNSWNFTVVLKLSWNQQLSLNFTHLVRMSWYGPLLCCRYTFLQVMTTCMLLMLSVK